jgi:hypothetical protein
MERAKLNRERRDKEVEAKVHSLEQKAAEQRGDAKARIEARIDSFRQKSEKPTEIAPTPQQKS